MRGIALLALVASLALPSAAAIDTASVGRVGNCFVIDVLIGTADGCVMKGACQGLWFWVPFMYEHRCVGVYECDVEAGGCDL